jgi:hypothetical protein
MLADRAEVSGRSGSAWQAGEPMIPRLIIIPPLSLIVVFVDGGNS